MSSNKEGKVLFISNLPPELISRKQLKNHFSAFGTVERISLDKRLGNCLITFSSHSDAFSAKLKGKIWNDISLNIYWDKNSSHDPRSSFRSEHSYETNEEVVDVLWSDDDKECFGIDEDKTSRAYKNKRQKTFSDLISSHLKTAKTLVESDIKRQSFSSSPHKNELELKYKERRKVPVVISGPDVPRKEKSIFTIRNTRQDVKETTPESTAFQFGESILKRKVEQSEDLSDSNRFKKESIIKTSRLGGKLGASVLKKKLNNEEGMKTLEMGQGDNFIERKIVEAMEMSSSEENKNGGKKQSKPKAPIKTAKSFKKKSLDLLGVNFKNKVAATLKEKYNLLDERDKALRKLEVKDSNIKTAGAMQGTCPDMCPEKERIMRSFQRLVSVYEMGSDKNEMVEHLAVKEYSRSSADQDEPLPHELRPEPVLTMTMNYLITNIIDRIVFPEENIAEWYNFCWDRLRGIRKDIIQQQLCNLQTVEIIEQCARFHIFCYDYLWGIDVSIFDEKINTENLMNCLQSLMHMYEDLSKQGINCPNEAEFNAYMIVLKLNSGDILWEYESFSSEVRVSPFIKAAINLYNAFNSKICSRFFRIVKKSPYLLACLSHRFFSKIRTSTLETIVKAYTPRGKEIVLPSHHLKSTLKLDTFEDTVFFCERHGIYLRENKQEFSIRTENFYTPESLINVKSFSSIVRDMRLTPAQAVVGENNKLPEYIPQEVHSSFDAEGKLKDDALDASDQLLKVKKMLNVNVPPAPKSPLKSFEPVTPISTTSSTIDQTDSGVKENKSTFMFALSQSTSSESFPSTTGLLSPKLMTGDVFKTQDNSFVEQDVLQMPIEDLPQDLYDPFYDAQGNQFNDIQAVEIDAERVEEMYQDVKKYYEDTREPDDKSNESSNKHINTSGFSSVKNESSAPSSPKSTFTFTLNNKENIFKTSDDSDKKIYFNIKLKDIKDMKEVSSSSLQNLRSIPEVKTNIFTYPDPMKESNLIFKLEEEKKKIDKIFKQREKQEELLRLEKEKKELEKAKRERKEKRRKEIEEAKLQIKLKKDLRKRLKVEKAAKYYAKLWKEKVERLKKTRADFPMLVQLSVKDHLTSWGTTGALKRPATVGIVQRLKQRNIISNIVNRVLQSGIPNSVSYVGDLLAEEIARAATAKLHKKGNIRPVFWKLIVSIPGSVNEDTATLTKLIEVWCKRTFYKNNAELGSVQRTITSLQIPVYICVHLLKNLNDTKLCSGMSSLMLVTVNQWETSEQTVNRFVNLITSLKSPNSCFVSVMKIGGIILDEKLKESLMAFEDEGIINKWNFQEWSNPKCVMQALNLMAHHIKVDQELGAAPIEFILKETVDQFFSALSADQYTSVGLRTAAQLPNNIIRLYNICLGKLEDLLVSSKLEMYSYFPEEFKPYISQLDVPGGVEQFSGRRFDNGYKMKISKIIQSLSLPEFTNWPPKSCDSLLKMLKFYCSKVNDITLLPRIIRLIDISEDEELSECLSISWINIVELWAKQMVSYQIEPYSKKIGDKTLVLYNRQDLSELVSSLWWLKTAIVVNNDNSDKENYLV